MNETLQQKLRLLQENSIHTQKNIEAKNIDLMKDNKIWKIRYQLIARKLLDFYDSIKKMKNFIFKSVSIINENVQNFGSFLVFFRSEIFDKLDKNKKERRKLEVTFMHK